MTYFFKEKFRFIVLLALFTLISQVLYAKDLILMGGSFDPPTAAHTALIKRFADRPDTDVVVMVNLHGSKSFNLSALERARLLLTELQSKKNVKLSFLGYTPMGAIPVIIKALARAEYEKVFYAIGADVHNSWNGILPQVGMKLPQPKPMHYIVIPRIDPKTGAAEIVELKNPALEEILSDITPSVTSSSQVRALLKEIPIHEENNLSTVPDLNDSIRGILAEGHLLRPKLNAENAYFKECYEARFIQIKNLLAQKYPQYAKDILSAVIPEYNATASIQALDERIIRSFVDQIMSQQKNIKYTVDQFPVDGKFFDSNLYFEFIDAIHPSYKIFSPHRPLFETVDVQNLANTVYPPAANQNTASLYQLPSGIFKKDRAAMHSEIINNFENKTKEAANSHVPPRVIFLAGPSGAGKSKVLEMIQKSNQELNLPILDIDVFRAAIIQKDSELKAMTDLVALGDKTHLESAYLQGMTWAKMVHENKSFIVDGTLSATDYFEKVIKNLQSRGYKVSILYVTAPLDQLKERIRKRALIEGRSVPEAKINASFTGSETSWERLSKIADQAIKISNPDSVNGVSEAEIVEALTLNQIENLKKPENPKDCGQWLVR